MKANNPKYKPYVRDESTTLISVRLEPKTVKAIDRWCEKYPIYNRSVVINRLLYACVALITPKDFKSLISHFHPDPANYNLIFNETPSV